MDYHGMKRCRFCEYWEWHDGNTTAFRECRRRFGPYLPSSPDANDVCLSFRSGGVLPEVAVEVAMGKAIPTVVMVEKPNLAWFERNPLYKGMYPLLYRKLQTELVEAQASNFNIQHRYLLRAEGRLTVTTERFEASLICLDQQGLDDLLVGEAMEPYHHYDLGRVRITVELLSA